MTRLTIVAEARQAKAQLAELNGLIRSGTEATKAGAAASRQVAAALRPAAQQQAVLAREAQRTATANRAVTQEAKRAEVSFRDVAKATNQAFRNSRSLRQETERTAQAAERAARSTRRASGGRSVGATSASAFRGAGGGAAALGLASLIPGGGALSKPISGALTGAFVGAAAGLPGIIAGSIVGGGAGITAAVGDVVSAGFKTAINFLEKGATVALVTAASVGAVSLRNAIAEQPLAEGFANIVDSRGLGEATEVLQGFRAAARGTVSDIDLLRSSNNAFLLGAAETTKQMEFLIEAGRRLGKATGRDATEGFNDLAVGIGRQSRLILDNLGLVVKVEAAQEAYASSVGTTAAKLGEAEKRLAFQQAAYESIREKLKDLGEEQDLAVDGLGRLAAGFSNLTAEIGTGALPGITEVAGAWGDFLNDLDGEQISAALGDLGAGVAAGIDEALDSILGKSSASRKALDDFASAFSTAFTDPSEEAFKVLGVRIEQLVETGKSHFRELWQGFLEEADRALGPIDELIGVSTAALAQQLQFAGDAASQIERQLQFAGIISGGSPEKDAAESAVAPILRALEGQGERTRIKDDADARVAAIQSGAAETSSEAARVQKEAAETQKEAADFMAASLKRVTAEREAIAAGFAPDGFSGGRTALQAQAAAERSSRQEAEALAAETRATEKEAADAQKAAKKAEAEELKKVRQALQDQQRELSRSATAINRELRERERAFEQLDAGLTNLSAAIDGEDAPVEVFEALNTLAEELREFPETLRGIREEIDNIGDEIAAERAALAADLDAAAASFRDDITRRAREFLLGGGVEGETTRVRGLRSKARREQRRRNRDIFQRTLGSASFDDPFGGGSPGGFGVQGVERSGGILDNVPSGLESAISQLVNNDGSTLVAEFQIQIAQIVAESAIRLDELNIRKAEALNQQAEVQIQQLEALDLAIDLEEKSIEITGELAADVAGKEARLASVESQLDRLRRQIRSLK